MRRGTIPCAILKQWGMSAAPVGGGCRAPLGDAAFPSLADAVHASAIAAAVNRTMSPLSCQLQLDSAANLPFEHSGQDLRPAEWCARHLKKDPGPRAAEGRSGEPETS